MKRIFTVLFLCAALPAWSQQRCSPAHIDVPKERTSATANSSANLRKSPESVRAQLSRLLGNAREQVAEAKPPAGKVCSAGCRTVGRPAHIVVSVVPKKFLSDYSDAQKCDDLLKQTSSRPFRFGPHRAQSEKELSAWLSDVSRGSGKDGALLYEKCSGKCSPRYFMDVVPDGEGFVANLNVVCGPARDKADNTFAIASAYRWACQSKG
jgi:hypothetical protein